MKDFFRRLFDVFLELFSGTAKSGYKAAVQIGYWLSHWLDGIND